MDIRPFRAERKRTPAEQGKERSFAAGCVRKVYNMALGARTEAWERQERIDYNQTSAMLTVWKKTDEKSKRKSRKSAEYTTSGFRFRDGRLTLAKMPEPLNIVWSRPLPEGAKPSTVTVLQDAAGRWFVSMLCDDLTVKPPGHRCDGRY